MTLTKIVDFLSGRSYVLYASLTILGTDTYATGGMTLNLAPIAKANRKPIVVWINSAGSGFDYYYVPGADAQTGKIKIIGSGTTSGGAKGELAAGTITAGSGTAITGDTIVVEAHFFGEM